MDTCCCLDNAGDNTNCKMHTLDNARKDAENYMIELRAYANAVGLSTNLKLAEQIRAMVERLEILENNERLSGEIR